MSALDTLRRLGVPRDADYHTLTSAQVDARRTRYRKPRNANGSTGRYFCRYLQRKASREAG